MWRAASLFFKFIRHETKKIPLTHADGILNLKL